MKKKPSTLAIIIAVIFSIFLFPFIFIGGLSSGVVFSLESMVAPDREEDLYQSFVDNGGVDWVYDLFLSRVEEGMGSAEEDLGIELEATELFPRAQVETMVYDVYHAVIKGREYKMDLSYQKDVMQAKLTEYFEANIDAEIENSLREEYGEAYELLEESKKQEIKAEARVEAEKVFYAEMDTIIEEEFGTLEKEISAEINGIYDTPEYKELMALEDEYGYSLTDRTELCSMVRLAGYILLGITALIIGILLLCHLFRPSGFFTAGVFTLVTGGVLLIAAKGMQGVLLSLIGSELSAEFATEEVPVFLMPMLEDVLGWCVIGFEKVGKIGLMATVVLVLVGILLLVIRKNKAEAEPVSVMEMQ